MVPKMMFRVIDVRDCARAHIIAMTSPKAPGNISFGIGTDYKLLHRLLGSVCISIRVECEENTRKKLGKLFGFHVKQPRISIEAFFPLVAKGLEPSVSQSRISMRLTNFGPFTLQTSQL